MDISQSVLDRVVNDGDLTVGLRDRKSDARLASDQCIGKRHRADRANIRHVVEGEQATPLPADMTTERDPTGAGDTFCGATLAGLARGDEPVQAAQNASALAARVIEHVGPAFLLGLPLIGDQG